MEAMEMAEAAMREHVQLQHLAQNVLTDTVVIELAQKLVPELPDTIAEWPMESIRELLPLLDTEASRITPDTFPDLDLSAYDCAQIFRMRIAILQTLLARSHAHATVWHISAVLSAVRQKLHRDVATHQGMQDVAGHCAGLAIAAVLDRHDISLPPPESAAWGSTEEWAALRASIATASAKVQGELLLGT